METIQFKTNIKCSGCVEKVTPGLNNTVGPDNWEVDIQSPNKVLTVAADASNEADIVAALHKAGYQAEKLN